MTSSFVISATGPQTLTVPMDCNSMYVGLLGGGGSPGGGGQFTRYGPIAVTPGQTFNCQVGIAGGTNGDPSSAPGTGDTWFDDFRVCFAQGGSTGANALGGFKGGLGDTARPLVVGYRGGNVANQPVNNGGSGGGGAAGPSGRGGDSGGSNNWPFSGAGGGGAADGGHDGATSAAGDGSTPGANNRLNLGGGVGAAPNPTPPPDFIDGQDGTDGGGGGGAWGTTTAGVSTNGGKGSQESMATLGEDWKGFGPGSGGGGGGYPLGNAGDAGGRGAGGGAAHAGTDGVGTPGLIIVTYTALPPRRIARVGLHYGKTKGTPPSASKPVNTVAPSIDRAIQGSVSTCTTGTWTGTAPIAFHFQWQVAGFNVGVDAATYTPQPADDGKALTCIVTAVNLAGSASQVSNSRTVTNAPVNIVAPSIDQAVVGAASTLSPGTWTGSPTPTLTYDWEVDATPTGSTGLTYTPLITDDGKALSAVVTGDNGVGSPVPVRSNVITITSTDWINIPDQATLYAMLNAGPSSSGGKRYRLAANDFGTLGIYNYDFSSNPIVIAGQTSGAPSTAAGINHSMSSGISWSDMIINGAGPLDSGSTMEINNSDPTFPSVLSFTRITTTSSDAMGTQTGGGWYIRNVRAGSITIVGNNDPTKPDIFGRTYGIAFTDTGWLGGTVMIRDMTFDNLGINQILGGGAQNVTIDHCLFQNQFWGAGDHPNVMHFFGDGATPSKNITVTNNGAMQGQYGGGAITLLQEGVVTAFVQNNWSLMGVFYDAWENSGGSDCTYDNNFGQGIASIGGSMLVRGGAVNCTTTNNTMTNASPFTYTPEGPYPGYSTSGNSVTSPPSASAWNDYTALNTWLATHTTARAHP